MSRQWGAALTGHDFDLHDWREMLKPPFDPWIEVHGAEHVLRSISLDDLASATEVRDRVVAHIERLNGTMLAIRQCPPLQFAGVVELAPGGKVHRSAFVEGAHIRLRAGIIAGTAIAGGVSKPERPPVPSEAQIWAAIADDDDFLEDALVYFGRVSATDTAKPPPTFWFDIYKALECLEKRVGGETSFLALGWAPTNDVKTLKRTANWARHARRKFEKPSPATTEREAMSLMSRLLRTAFKAAATEG